MNLKNIIIKKASRGGLIVRKYSPEILLGVGVVGLVASTVLACKASTKAEFTLDTAKDKLDKVKEVKENYSLEEYSETDYKKDLVIVYTQTAVDFIKLYGPSVTLGIVSLGCILGAHGILKKRNVALMAAYKVLEQNFGNYRNRVIEKYGKEADKFFKTGVYEEEIKEIDENGKKVKKIVEKIDPNGVSQYARFFDESSNQWSKTPEYNLTFLKCQQNYANDLLKSRGHVFLNEVYDMIGVPRTQAGAVVGWILGEGDDYIDFGIFNGENMCNRDFVNGYERSVLLDFNVAGVIYDMI